MKQFGFNASGATNELRTNANMYTFATSDDIQGENTNSIMTYEVTSSALDFQSIGAVLHADSELITEVAPDYKPYLEEGCEVAFISESTSSAGRDTVLNAMKRELSEYTYYLLAHGSGASAKYLLIAFGTSNVTETQFYQPVLSTNSDVKTLTLWD